MADALIGRELKGRYRLIDERGRGNFGTVYLARDLVTNYVYAAKIMRVDHTNDQELVERFKREAFILYHLHDKHIARVTDYGNEGQLYYIILHHIDGQSLKYLMQQTEQFELPRALDYIHQAAEGLDAAYKRGVVHRDIKPQNMLVTNKGILKLADFGLSRSRDMFTITNSEKFMGTAYYAAPEQIMSSHAVDTRADLYALSVVLFEMLAGHPPYSGGSALDVILMHTNTPVPSLCQLRPELPQQFDGFIQKTLAKDPEARFQSPLEYIAALEQLQQIVRGGEKTVRQTQARLVLLEGGQTFLLQGATLLVGRDDPRREVHPDIVLDDESKTVGRVHACLSYQQGQWSVEDRNSRNKTRLNGDILQPFEPVPLKDGDRLRFGRIEARFEMQ